MVETRKVPIRLSPEPFTFLDLLRRSCRVFDTNVVRKVLPARFRDGSKGATKATSMIFRSTQPALKARPSASDRALGNDTGPNLTGNDFPVVALGASAGGLETFKKFFDVLPSDSGIAFVLIQHLDPTHKSLMADLLAGHTKMPVMQATDWLMLERDHVYLIPPGVSMAIEAGVLRLSEPLERHGKRMPFDVFLRSLADDCGPRAIAVTLSGTGTDGSLGSKAIKAKGGLVIAQDPNEASYDGMPRSVIVSGDADFVLPVTKIPEAIIRYASQPYVKTAPGNPDASSSDPNAFGQIIELLAATTPNNFSLYKAGTLQRRIERRMAMKSVSSSADYLAALQSDLSERDLLAKDLLINVTQFFRDAPAFELLADVIIPDLVADQTSDQPLRIWVPGCSTGEEAYSLAMLFLEQITLAKRNIKLQVFASDIDAGCLAMARNGIYPASIADDVTPARLKRFFTQVDHSYQVVRELREAVVFTGQSLLEDAPYSRLDMVSCRNLLIYLNPDAQRKVLSLFHFALRDGGVLFLGSSETVGSLSDRFAPINKKHRIYRHVGQSKPGEVEFPIGLVGGTRPTVKGLPYAAVHRSADVGELSQRALLEAYAPASVLINAKYEGLHYFGATDRYLKVAAGEQTADVLAMARDGLGNKLRSAIQRAKAEQKPATVVGAHVRRDDGTITVDITARPVGRDGDGHLLISFIDAPLLEVAPALHGHTDAELDAAHVSQIERELDATRKELQSAISDLESSNEEHKAINEEAMSLNEEFQSTNEELETSKEELQSLNEELIALNGQLHETVEQQRAASSDLQNILDSTDVATLFLDENLKIRFFTPAAKSLFNVMQSDIGRPLEDFTRRFEDEELLTDAAAVLANHIAVRREIKAADGRWFIRSMLPYRSDANSIAGVVITFSSIAEIKAVEHALEAAKAEAERANLGKSRFLAAASHDLRQPLQTISLLQGILEKRAQDEPMRKLVRRLDTTVRTMASMLDKLLNINQLEAGIVKPVIVDVPIAGVLDLLRAEFAYHASTNGLGWYVAPCSLTIRSDSELLEQIIRNLLSNAIKYTTQGKVLLGCRRRGDKLRIEVWDTGGGIPKQALDVIFDEFQQLDNPARERSKGLGLGLTIVQRLADLLGHKIDVQSRPGSGSNFSIEVPLVQAQRPRPALLAEARERELKATSRGTILIVEDDPDILEMLQLLLDDEGHRTLIAADGHKALLLAAEESYVLDLIITDYNLPNGLNGLETIARIQAHAQHAIPAIILTGDISTDSLREIVGHGRFHMNKPVRAGELISAAQKLLAKPKTRASANSGPPLKPVVSGATTTVYVIDDDRAVQEAMRDLLIEGGHRVELFAGGAAFFDAHPSGSDGCLLVDALMPDMSGLEVIGRLRSESRTLPAIVITGHGDIALAVQAMKAGAVDFIEKPAHAKELFASVAKALSLTHDTTTQTALHDAAVNSIASLTTRQREILKLVLEGHPSKNIAADLGISQRTIDNHRAAIMHKTGAKSLSALIRIAIAAG